MVVPFFNRNAAGKLLAERLTSFATRPDVVVLALPRGGVPVGYEIARELAVSFDVCIVRKLGVPQQPELAFGAIASDDIMVLNPGVMDAWNLSSEEIELVIAQERQELARREQAYCQGRRRVSLADRKIILVDDGIATGATIKAAISVIRQYTPKEINVVIPIVSRAVFDELKAEVERCVCLAAPETFRSIGEWYVNF
ncbi:MAG: phosphoribosyltransferase family protein, partial [Cyanobacteria bacterium P01_E01_bin.34]